MSAFSSLVRPSARSFFAASAKPFTCHPPSSLFGIALLLAGAAHLTAQAPTPVPVPAWRYDNGHAGQNTNETALTPANVNVNTFGKLFSLAVDGNLYAQPLYIPGLTMGDGQVHNVLFIATEHDSVYAFDADSNGGSNANPLWKISLLDKAHGAPTGATTVSWLATGSEDIQPEVGVTGTPVIDPSTNTMYVVGSDQESGTVYMKLHALNILTGAEQANSPVKISATVSGTGIGSSGGSLSFSPTWQNQRGALSFYNGHVYISFGSHGDNGPWHGWVFAYDGTSLAQTGVMCASPNGFGAGIWASGAALPIDDGGPAGRMFAITGNGTYTTYPPFNASSEFGESLVNFDLSSGGVTPTDAFTSFNQAKLTISDLDQGSGGILMVPDQQGSTPHVAVQVGKEGRILVVNRDHLGGYAAGASSNTNILQDILGQTKGLWSTPSYWNGNVYMWGSGDVARMFPMNSGVMDTTPSSKATITSAYPGANITISSNGAQDGIAWAIRSDAFTTHGPEILYAWDATNLSNLLYESDTKPTRDGAGNSMKFAIPVVTNGKVYVGAAKVVSVFGLFQGQPTVATPVISPNGGTFSTPQTVQLSSTTASASIYYTLDGSVPTPSSTLYSDALTISTATTLRAMADAPNYVQSAIGSATFSFLTQTPTVGFSPAAGTYFAAQLVKLTDSDANATIYYTTDGSTPTANSLVYSAPIPVTASTTINAIAIDTALQDSSVAAAAYGISAALPAINFPTGFASVAGLTLNGNAINTDDSRLQLTSGALYQRGSMFNTQAVGITQFTTQFGFQLSYARGDGFTFTIQNVSPKSIGAGGSGLGYGGIKKSVAIKFDLYSNAGEGVDSTGVYTNGATPTVPSVDMTASGVALRSGDSILANVTYDGKTLTMNLLDLVTNKTFTLTKAINIPQVVGAGKAYIGFTGSTGGLTASQKILYWTYTGK